ncbi:Uncharacterized protein OBRU01_11386 [Operophtera brumata]|uniref:Cytochrome oxidase complex assembly protein 1 n=1 Tax=Operophtera brumata TaxID=104452 RepID=A0A0L7LD04_OPEBR|nr:Uncharacterized protein OBRU01_11386 [Operophtera brumata]
MTVSNGTLIKIAAWGGVILSTTGFILQNSLVHRVRGFDYYKTALKKLRQHPGAVHYLGEPIKDRGFKLSDTENNCSDGRNARFSIPVSGPKDRGTYYFWAVRENDEWTLTRAELELKSKPDARLIIHQ